MSFFMPLYAYMVQKNLYVLLYALLCLYVSKKPLCSSYMYLYAYMVQKNLYVLLYALLCLLWFKKPLCPSLCAFMV